MQSDHQEIVPAAVGTAVIKPEAGPGDSALHTPVRQTPVRIAFTAASAGDVVPAGQFGAASSGWGVPPSAAIQITSPSTPACMSPNGQRGNCSAVETVAVSRTTEDLLEPSVCVIKTDEDMAGVSGGGGRGGGGGRCRRRAVIDDGIVVAEADGPGAEADGGGGGVSSFRRSKLPRTALEETSPSTIQGPTIQGPHIQGPHIQGPTIQEPTIQGPHIQEPHIQEPHVQEPSVCSLFIQPTVKELIDRNCHRLHLSSN